MSVIVRFAPSPTGRLHIGNVRTALLNWLFARRHGGHFILRLDDTDRERSTDANAEAIRTDLTWLGLTWDSTFRQSARTQRYDEVKAQLITSGRLYPCYETEDELDRRRKLQMARGLPPLYDRAALRLSAADRARFEADGIKPHWRFRLANTEPHAPDKIVPTLVRWPDLVRGDQAIDVSSMSDPVVARGDGTYLYTFTSVVDDIDTKITHIIRGEDHVTNSGVQAQLFEALRAAVPAMAHFSLLIGANGEALSKRLGSLSVEAFRAEGLEPMAINSLAALIGTSAAVQPYATLEGLAASFDLGHLSRSPSRFDTAELEALNAKLLHVLPYCDVAAKLKALAADGGETEWNAVRGNLAKLADAKVWHDVIHGDAKGVVEDAAFCASARDVLPPEPWDEATWGTWTNAVKAATGAKGRALFHPLRLALTGRENGPELRALLPLIGRARAAARLSGVSG
jgi:glutamyl-tRNA synthetase